MEKIKYIFVVGGVMSGVGKGVTTASIAKILKGKGFRVSPIKIDPYLNVDAGTMNPTEHGEVFVLDSGLECDQDMGNYERFLDISLPPENYMTNGMVFKAVIDKERSLGYGGKCVEPVFHITEEILRRIDASIAKMKPDICIMEIGGTVGEYQNAIFIEAARILKLRKPKDVMFVMVSYLPIPGKLGEMKTKPTQSAIRMLNSYGVQPDIIIARAEVPLDAKRKQKIAESNGVCVENVISAPDVESIYDVPVNFEKDGLSKTILDFFDLRPKKADLKDWRRMLSKQKNAKEKVKIAVVGKYFKTGDFMLSDAYISVIEAVKHAGTFWKRKSVLTWLDSEEFEKNPAKLKGLLKYNGIIVPGGFGTRGIEGIIKTIEYARKNKIPYLGLCYGMQLAVIEYARNVVGIKSATTREIDTKAKNLVVDIMPTQIKNIQDGAYGGTMRLGSYKAYLKKGSVVASAYGTNKIEERHRHRYEINPAYIERLESAGLVFSGRSPNGMLMEIAELPHNVHPFFVGTQFHPEFKSTPLNPHPLFREFVKTAISKKKK